MKSQKFRKITRVMCLLCAVALALSACARNNALSENSNPPAQSGGAQEDGEVLGETLQSTQDEQKDQGIDEGLQAGSMEGTELSESLPQEQVASEEDKQEEFDEIHRATVAIVEQNIADALYSVGESAKPLSVRAEGSEHVYYRWYANDKDLSYGGTLIPNARDREFIPPTKDVGGVYYYCVAYCGEGENQAQSVGDVAYVNTQNITPVITSQPQDTVVKDAQIALTLRAESAGELSYRWYEEGGTPVADGTQAQFTPNAPVDIQGYYCVVTALYEGESRQTVSKTAYIAPADGAVQGNSFSYGYVLGAVARPLSVQTTGAGEFLYQWYENSVDSYDGATEITGETGSTYLPSTNTSGMSYYFCKVTQNILGQSFVILSKVCYVSVA